MRRRTGHPLLDVYGALEGRGHSFFIMMDVIFPFYASCIRIFLARTSLVFDGRRSSLRFLAGDLPRWGRRGRRRKGLVAVLSASKLWPAPLNSYSVYMLPVDIRWRSSRSYSRSGRYSTHLKCRGRYASCSAPCFRDAERPLQRVPVPVDGPVKTVFVVARAKPVRGFSAAPLLP